MPKLHQIIERHWQRPNPFLSFLLKPLSKLFAKIAAKRRDDFVSGRLKSEKLPVPVVVVGNIHAGGTGKTPIVAALVSGLQEKGVKVGIISRGYGRKSKAVHVLNAASRAEDAGDEPLLLFRKTGAPTAVGSSRAEAGRALLAAHPDIRLIVADDGLQHYALRRDVEITVFPAADTGRTDLDLLPNGSLREPLSRLDSVDAVVVSGGKADASFAPSENMFHSRIETGRIYRLNQPSEILDTGRLKNQTVAAVAFFRFVAEHRHHLEPNRRAARPCRHRSGRFAQCGRGHYYGERCGQVFRRPQSESCMGVACLCDNRT